MRVLASKCIHCVNTDIGGVEIEENERERERERERLGIQAKRKKKTNEKKRLINIQM